MKVTKSHLKKIIKEEISQIPDFSKMEDLLRDLSQQLKNLDLSIDYLASALTCDDPLEIGLAQGTYGRVHGAPKPRAAVKENKIKITKQQIKEIIKGAISEQNINLSDLEDELGGKSDEQMEKDITTVAEKLLELEKQMEAMKEQYQAFMNKASEIIAPAEREPRTGTE